MGRFVCLAALAALVGVAGCSGVERYPISRELARPDDPVHRMVVPPIPDVLW